ncbi:MAG: L-aspartate oxidase [Chloroflexi bacterium]|nr:L-aspartate oxidase [Chloroflexota bacterium]
MRYDYIIAGSGIAGLYAALLAREHGSVLVLTKGSIEESNTRYAQGGIAAALGPDDSPDLHLRDTIEAGAGLVDEEAARVLVSEAAQRIGDLVRFGVPFDTDGGAVALGREGAHSRSRILHAGGDATGAHIELSLSSLARLSRIDIKEHCLVEEIAVEGGRAAGVATLDTRSNVRETFEGRAVVLATGGCGQLYRVTTNPEVATGDGVAVAYRAGAEVMDMEFIQFHPTALRLPGAPVFLISEAVRGEGGLLKDAQGRRFMPEYDERAELAPRDIVARAIHTELVQSGSDCVYLDVTHLPPERVSARFPQIYRYCLEHGLDITKQPVPVSPAAHYMMGGVRTNVWGDTTLPGFYACGECACTGVHGANRLASNSLLETVVFARRVVDRARAAGETPAAAPRSADAVALPPAQRRESPPPGRPALQELLWEEAGIVRDGETLRHACATLSAWQAALPEANGRPGHELANLLLCGRLVAEAALLREESRGAHYRRDFPQPRDEWRRHLVFRRDE